MTRIAFVLGLAVAIGGCKSDTDEPAPGTASGATSSGSAPSAKSGFGAQLNEDLTGTPPSGSAAPAAASGSGGPPAVAASGSGGPPAVAASGSGGPAAAASGSGTPTPVAASGTGAPTPTAGSAKSAPTPTPTIATGSSGPPPPPPEAKPRVPVKPPPEVAAIKLSLQPNWDRDIGDAATISLVVKRASGEPAVFTFGYGYDDPRAPTDRDAYIKFLGDQKLLAVTLNRQRGAAWYLEGTDANGAPAFRYLVNYGGKHLICGGSLYKDAQSSQMGDIRDEVINQAKKICETLAL